MKQSRQMLAVAFAAMLTMSSCVFTTDGFSWWLQNSVDSDSGRLTELNYDPPSYVNGFFVTEDYLAWKLVNPAPGVFDFSALDDLLVDTGDMELTVRLGVVSACDVPAWVAADVNSLDAGTLVFWEQAYLDALTPLVEAFAAEYASNDRIVGVYLPIADGEFSPDGDCSGDRDGWGEMWMAPDVLAEAQDDFGMTPTNFAAAVTDIVDMWVGAFAPYEGKLAYTNLDQLYSFGHPDAAAYNAEMAALGLHALLAGTGARDGQVESWMRYIDPLYGVGLEDTGDGTCRMTFNEEYASAMEGRYSSSENEFYGDYPWVIADSGPLENQPYRFLTSSMRVLQLRRDDMQLTETGVEDAVYNTDEMYEYLTKTLGRNRADTPDVVSLLGERYVYTPKVAPEFANLCSTDGYTTVRNIERWLVEVGDSDPARRVDFPADENYWGQGFYINEEDPFEYSARASSQFAFDIDDTVDSLRCGASCDVSVHVTYDATGAAASTLALQTDAGASSVATVEADSGVKTANFLFTDMTFTNGFTNGADFLVNADASLPVMMVRVTFLPG